MLGQLWAAFSRKINKGEKNKGEVKQRQPRSMQSRVRLSLEPLEDRLALSTMGSVDPTALMQSMPAVVNLEQQFFRQIATNVAGLLTAEAQMVSPISPPLASLLQSEAQFVMSLAPQTATASTTGIHEYPIPPGNIFPPPLTASASASGIHEYPIPPNNIFPHPFT